MPSVLNFGQPWYLLHPSRTFCHFLLLISFFTFLDELIKLLWLKVKAAGNPFPNHCSPPEMCFRDLLAVILSCLNFGADLTFEFKWRPFFFFFGSGERWLIYNNHPPGEWLKSLIKSANPIVNLLIKSASFHGRQFKLHSGMDSIEIEKHTPLLTCCCSLHLKVITYPAYPDLFSAQDCIAAPVLLPHLSIQSGYTVLSSGRRREWLSKFKGLWLSRSNWMETSHEIRLNS